MYKDVVKILVVIVLLIVASVLSSGFTVTGKQITTIYTGNNIKTITVTNPTDDILVIKLIVTEEQYYTPDNITFSISENWQQKFNSYSNWQKVDWIDVKYSEAVIPPHMNEKIRFSINIPENITRGTFYAKLEVKDIGEKQGLIVIRPIYVSQLVAHISSRSNDTEIPDYFFYIDIGIILLLIVMKKKLHRKIRIK